MTAFLQALGYSAFFWNEVTGVPTGQRDAPHQTLLPCLTARSKKEEEEWKIRLRGATVEQAQSEPNSMQCRKSLHPNWPISSALCPRPPPHSPVGVRVKGSCDARSTCGLWYYDDGMSSQLCFSYLSLHASPPPPVYLFTDERAEKATGISYISSAVSGILLPRGVRDHQVHLFSNCDLSFFSSL